MSSPPNKLSMELINELLSTPQGTGRTRGPKVDPTVIREVNVWFKLNHHLCMPDCEHRTNRPEGTSGPDKACWNPECVDPRPASDRGSRAVALVKTQYICRYCFLAGYLA